MTAEMDNKRHVELIDLMAENAKLREALELIATPKRADGTYNRCREACEQLARETLAASAEPSKDTKWKE